MTPRWVVLAAVLTIAVPAAAVAASSRIELPAPTVVQDSESGNILTPVDEGIEVRAQRADSGQRLTWKAGSPWQANVFYRVYRTERRGPDTQCLLSGGVAWYCHLRSVPIATTRAPEFFDPSPVPGATYRIGVGTNWLDDPEQGDVFVFSPPVPAAP